MSGEEAIAENLKYLQELEREQPAPDRYDPIVEGMARELVSGKTLEELATVLPEKVELYQEAQRAHEEMRSRATQAHNEEITMGRDVLATQKAIAVLVNRLGVRV